MGIYQFKDGVNFEEKATEFLKKQGYKIIEKNFKCKLGEIDIIAANGGYLCFVEVKYRSSTKFGRPSEAVDYFKQQKLIRAAQYYIKMKRLNDCNCRFDVVEILNDEISIIKNAFNA